MTNSINEKIIERNRFYDNLNENFIKNW
jgi:hypothetical protein